MRNLVIRSLSGAVLVAIFVGAIFVSQSTFRMLILLLILGCLTEFYSLCRKGAAAPQSQIGLLMSVGIFYLNYIAVQMLDAGAEVPKSLGSIALPVALGLMLLFPLVFVCELWRKSENPIANISATFGGLFYAAVPLSLMMYLPMLLNDGRWSPSVMFGYVAMIWANDVFAYLTGCTIGKHKLFERISPKKSWEGFFGGIVGAVAVALLVGRLTGGNMAIWGGLAVVTALSGVGGDLVESMFKRSVGVKDSGNIIPGHGGFLDRFDALLVSTPFAIVFLLLTKLL